MIRADFDPVEIARTYQRHGAACISVLTDAAVFPGQPGRIFARSARRSICPCCGRTSSSTRYQVLEARAAGADAVLLIAECLDDCNLRTLHNEAVAIWA